jgi:hypothetical protein
MVAIGINQISSSLHVRLYNFSPRKFDQNIPFVQLQVASSNLTLYIENNDTNKSQDVVAIGK